MYATESKFFKPTNISPLERVVRFTMGTLMIGVVFVHHAQPLEWLTLFPLAAIYPMLSAILGWDPIYALILDSNSTALRRAKSEVEQTARLLTNTDKTVDVTRLKESKESEQPSHTALVRNKAQRR